MCPCHDRVAISVPELVHTCIECVRISMDVSSSLHGHLYDRQRLQGTQLQWGCKEAFSTGRTYCFSIWMTISFELLGHKVHTDWLQVWTSRSLSSPPFGNCCWPALNPVVRHQGRSTDMPTGRRSWTISGLGCAIWISIISSPFGAMP